MSQPTAADVERFCSQCGAERFGPFCWRCGAPAPASAAPSTGEPAVPWPAELPATPSAELPVHAVEMPVHAAAPPARAAEPPVSVAELQVRAIELPAWVSKVGPVVLATLAGLASLAFPWLALLIGLAGFVVLARNEAARG